MTRARTWIVAFLILILGGGAGAWWYLFGPNKVDAAELVPGDSVFFATIPNAASIIAGYQTSQLKQLVDAPNAKPVADSLANMLGPRNLELLNTFLPNLSGQSFIAVTHYDSAHPEQTGIIAGLHPKSGMRTFDAFVEKLKATYPDILKQGTTGTGNVLGVDYQWLRGPGGADKLCVAQMGGWIITTWGEAPLQDWIVRYRKGAATPSLAQNADYQKTVTQVGKDSMSLLYLNYHVLGDILEAQMKSAPGGSDMIKRFSGIGGMTVGTAFVNGEIKDRYTYQLPKQEQLASGIGATPCPFETLKFSGPATRIYWATSIDWKQYWKNLTAQSAEVPAFNTMTSSLVHNVETLAKNSGLDVQHNIIDPLGSEMSIQVEWNDDATYPEVGLFLKVDKPDDFKPTINALIQTARNMYSTSAVINQLTTNGQAFSALKFVQTTQFIPTITEGGPYLGLFSSENIAVRSYARDTSVGLPSTAPFSSQIGDNRNGASQIGFVDSPHLLDRAYRTALPYVSLLSMFNKNVAAFVQKTPLPDDLTWLAPMGTWSYVLKTNDQGVEGYSVSGIGNQGILYAVSGGTAFTMAQSMGMVPKMPVITPSPTPIENPLTPVPTTTGTTTPAATQPPADATTATPPVPMTNSAPVPDASAPVPPAPAPTNAPTAPTDASSTH